jgi:hypothetical protein
MEPLLICDQQSVQFWTVTLMANRIESSVPRPPRETPIERIFREIMRQKMPLAISDILLRKPSLPSLKLPPSARA